LVHIPTVVASIHVQSSFWTYDASLLLLVPPILKYRPVKQIPNNLAAAHQPIRLIFFTMIVVFLVVWPAEKPHLGLLIVD
jgi:hypothetical protein